MAKVKSTTSVRVATALSKLLSRVNDAQKGRCFVYKLKVVNGKVAFLIKTSKDYFRSVMPALAAQHIVFNGKEKKSLVEGKLINIDDRWLFEVEKIPDDLRPPVASDYLPASLIEARDKYRFSMPQNTRRNERLAQ